MADKMNPETFSLIYLLKSEIQQKINQNNFLSLNKQLRHYISLCNSVCIKLIQNASFSEVQFIKKKSEKADVLLEKYGSLADKFWQGRILAWIIQTYYYWITRQIKFALQLMYRTHLLIEEIKNAGGILNKDLKIVTDFISFLVLWTADRTEKCEDFLKEVKKSIEREEKDRKKGRLDFKEVRVLVFMAVAGFLFRVSGNYLRGIKILSDLSETAQDSACFGLLKKMIQVAWKEQDLAFSSEFGSKEILVTLEFERIVFDVFVAPFKNDDCPMVEISDNLNATSKSSTSHSDKASTNSTFSKSSTLEMNHAGIKRNMRIYYQQRINPAKMNIYSPSLGVTRPVSSLRFRNNCKARPKSTGKYN
jgi:hypothetical protein